MPRRKLLNGVAAGLLGSFMSRNNDYDGYWAIGQLYKNASEHGAAGVDIGLVGPTLSQSDPLTRHLSSNYGALLSRLCSAVGIPSDQVHSAAIRITFNIDAPDGAQTRNGSFGDPFSVEIDIEDDLGKHHTAYAQGYSRHHDPQRELRRAL